MKKSTPSISVRRSLVKFGQDIRTARLRRNLTMRLIAERAKISLSTLNKIEKGDPDVSLGNYSSVLFALNLGAPFADLADPAKDAVGLLLDLDSLPRRAGRRGKINP
jgi:transcriptional regulator with XRE-family HTH domain